MHSHFPVSYSINHVSLPNYSVFTLNLNSLLLAPPYNAPLFDLTYNMTYNSSMVFNNANRRMLYVLINDAFKM